MSSSPVDLRVDWCSYKAAKYAVEHWHYSQAMPTPPAHYIGVWESGAFVGCVIFGRGSNNNGHKPYGVKMTEFCELTRVAMRDHVSPVSQVVAKSLKLLKTRSVGIRLVVSYADPNHAHTGAIYQAGNWIYTGKTSADFEAIDKSGRKWHSRQVSRTGVSRQYGEFRRVPKHSECIIVPLEGKHRYLYPLDRAMRRQIVPLAQPYPKRETSGPSVEGDTLPQAESQVRSLGAAPNLYCGETVEDAT